MNIWRDFIQRFNIVKGRLDITPAHIYLTLKLAALKEGVSRYVMITNLRISEAKAKTLQKKLKELNILKPLRGGHILTEYGNKLFNYLSHKLVDIGYIPTKDISRYCYAILLKKYNRVPNAVLIRDTIIRFGGSAGLVLYKIDSKIIFPESGEPLSTYDDKLNSYLLRKGVEDGDLILIAGSSDEYTSKLAVLNTALSILEKIE